MKILDKRGGDSYLYSMNYIIGQDRNQVGFSSLDQTISGDNPVRLIDLFVGKLPFDKMAFEKATHADEGRPPFHPACLLKLYLYGYLNRVRSSRRLERECILNLEVHRPKPCIFVE
ncbi:MAG: transposase [Bacteroidetes bacterium]|nr:transposase [Bacteroidota bacterium]